MIQLPLGLGLNFLINGIEYVIPMAIEEPSVIAAASSAAKFIGERGAGFKVHTTEPVMCAQIQIIGVNYDKVKYSINEHKQAMIDHANTHCKRMFQRGGGVKDLRHKKIYELKTDSDHRDVIVVELLIDVQESMGMNICNTIAEESSEFIRSKIGEGTIGLRITSNLCLERIATSFFKIPVEKLSWKELSGKDVAAGIMSAFEFGMNDVARATTHNKGIMNGIDAVAIALGQDWRAIESASHAFASLDNGYKPLSKYRIVKDNIGKEYLIGKLELPLS
jgi:degradative hydroxymethylglutaryl-CoA reductase